MKEETDKKETKIKEIEEEKRKRNEKKKTYLDLDLWGGSVVWLELGAADARSVDTGHAPERTVLEKQRSN